MTFVTVPKPRINITHSPTPRRYNPCRVLADSRRLLQPSLSLVLILQFLTPNLSVSLITPSIHLRFGLPALLLPSGLSKVIFLHGRLSCIRTICPAHLNLVILIVATRSVSSYRHYSYSLYVIWWLLISVPLNTIVNFQRIMWLLSLGNRLKSRSRSASCACKLHGCWICVWPCIISVGKVI